MKNRILLSLLMIAGSIQAHQSTPITSDSSYESSYNHTEYDYEADDIAFIRSILTYDTTTLQNLIRPGREKIAIKFLAPNIDFNQYDVEYFESATFLHLLTDLIDQDNIDLLQSNTNLLVCGGDMSSVVADYTSKVIGLMKFATEIGIDINAVDCHGQTALHNAVELGAFDAAIFLIQSGANINQISAEGLTPVQLACFDAVERSYELTVINTLFPSHESDDEEGYEEALQAINHITLCKKMIKILIDNGADISIKNTDGETALEYIDNTIQEIDEHLDFEDNFINETDSVNFLGFKIGFYNTKDLYNALVILKSELVAIKAILQS